MLLQRPLLSNSPIRRSASRELHLRQGQSKFQKQVLYDLIFICKADKTSIFINSNSRKGVRFFYLSKGDMTWKILFYSVVRRDQGFWVLVKCWHGGLGLSDCSMDCAVRH